MKIERAQEPIEEHLEDTKRLSHRYENKLQEEKEKNREDGKRECNSDKIRLH